MSGSTQIVPPRRWISSVLLPVALAIAGGVAHAQFKEGTQRWSEEALRVAVLGCRTAILDNATREYARRQGISASQLPPDFRERVSAGLEPLLVTCDCIIATLSVEISQEEFNLQSPQARKRVAELLGPGGACARKQGV